MTRPPPAPHGTEQAYRRHRRHFDDPCPECVTAHEQWLSARRQPKPAPEPEPEPAPPEQQPGDGTCTSAEASVAAGVTYRVLDHWCRQGYVTTAGDSTPGPGRARRWAPENVALLARMARLVTAGLQPWAAAEVARTPGQVQMLAPGVYVLINDTALHDRV